MIRIKKFQIRMQQMYKTRPYRLRAKPLDIAAQGVISATAKEIGFVEPDIILRWKGLVGDIFEIAKITGLRYNTKINRYTATILINDIGLWGQWKMIEPSIVMKLESALKRECRVEVKLQHST